MTVIELGEISSGSSADPAPRRLADVRRPAVAAVALVCVLALTGSARPEPHALPVLWSMQMTGDKQFVLTGDTVYTVGPTAMPTLTALEAQTGAVRWSLPLSYGVNWPDTSVPGVVLLPAGPEQVAVPDGLGNTLTETVMTDTSALDARTGKELWRRTGAVALTMPDAVLLTDWDNARRRIRTFRLVRPGDGHTIWTLPASPGVVTWTTTGRDRAAPDRLVTATADGRLQVRRFSDLTLVAAGRVPWTAATDGNSYTDLTGADGVLRVNHSDGLRITVRAYAADTLRQLWQATGLANYGTFDCGPVVCLGAEPRGLAGLDGRTGAVRWQLPQWDYAQPVAGGRLLVETRESSHQALVDGATGRPLADFGNGYGVVDGYAGPVLSLAPTRKPAGLMAVRQLGPDGAIVLRGVVGRLGEQGCQLSGDRLACLHLGGQFTVRDVG